MQLGYLGRDGTLVAVDTLGARAVYKAYRLDPAKPSLEFLGKPRPTEAVGDVAVTVELHRRGWAQPGEVVLKRSNGRLVRTRTHHAVVGRDFRAIKPLMRVLQWTPGDAFTVPRPFLSTLPPLAREKGVAPPPRKAPFVVLFHDRSVKAVRRDGSRVTLFATEMKEFTGFVLGKARAVLEFAGEREAEAFAKDFPRVADPASMDGSVKVDVDRSRKRAWGRRRIAALGLLVAFAVLVPAVVLIATAPVARSNPGVASGIRAGLTGFELFVVLGLIGGLRAARKENLDLAEKWPRVELERWCRDAIPRGHAMPEFLKEIGVELDPVSGSLEPLDRFLRGLPPDTFFGSLALDLAAFVGVVMLARVGRETDAEWTINPDNGQPVLQFPSIELWLSPLYLVGQVWERKSPETLDTLVDEWAKRVQTQLSFRSVAEFIAAGFLPTGWEEFEAFEARLRADLEKAPATSYVLGEDHFRLRRAAYGAFGVEMYEVEVETPRGPSFAPVVALPFAETTQRVHGRLEGAGAGTAPKAPQAREDLAFVRLEGAELLPLGVQVRNYAELGPSFAERKGRIEIELLALVDQAQVIGPRMRQARPEAKDALAPLHPTPEGMPASPYANFLGRVTSVAETVNPFHGTPLWRVGLDVSGFALEVLVRKDRCDGLPEVGHHLTGSTWLLGRLGPEKAADATYIR